MPLSARAHYITHRLQPAGVRPNGVQPTIGVGIFGRGMRASGGWSCRNSELETSKLERRSWRRADTVAVRQVAVAQGYIRPHNWRVERCQGGVAGGFPPHKGGPERPDRPTAVDSGQELPGGGCDSVAARGRGICPPILGCTRRTIQPVVRFSQNQYFRAALPLHPGEPCQLTMATTRATGNGCLRPSCCEEQKRVRQQNYPRSTTCTIGDRSSLSTIPVDARRPVLYLMGSYIILLY